MNDLDELNDESLYNNIDKTNLSDDKDDEGSLEGFKNSLKNLDPPRILITPSPDEVVTPLYY